MPVVNKRRYNAVFVLEPGIDMHLNMLGMLHCVTISKLGQKVTLQGIEPGSLL
jgi:hypothetical protein